MLTGSLPLPPTQIEPDVHPETGSKKQRAKRFCSEDHSISLASDLLGTQDGTVWVKVQDVRIIRSPFGVGLTVSRLS